MLINQNKNKKGHLARYLKKGKVNKQKSSVKNKVSFIRIQLATDNRNFLWNSTDGIQPKLTTGILARIYKNRT